ncbi:hypothetical protein DB459_20750 [Bradyrhizobium sp. WD16]|nr:hypothetical protein DB459_20750 [Bradyrhizobium sp. WD16]
MLDHNLGQRKVEAVREGGRRYDKHREDRLFGANLTMPRPSYHLRGALSDALGDGFAEAMRLLWKELPVSDFDGELK